MNAPDFDAAQVFVAANARVVDWRRFERLFCGGAARPVRDAVAAYRNDDGGFGHALEPDCRDPASQPAATEMAFRVMDETGSWDDELVRGACDWLEAVAPAEGGAVVQLKVPPRANPPGSGLLTVRAAMVAVLVIVTAQFAGHRPQEGSQARRL
jgi:hypothetical protein